MNPLDMTGPEFLQFYLIYGVAGLALAALLRALLIYGLNPASGERRWTPGYYPHDDEAYGIVLLRGGRKEAVRTVLGRLVTSGPFNFEGGELRRSSERREEEAGLSRLECQAMNAISVVQTVPEADRRVEEALEPDLARIESDLENQGLTPVPAQRRGFWWLLTFALLAIPGLGLAKLAVALARGRTNVLFLLLLLAVYTFAAVGLLRPPRVTPAGRRYLTWLRESHQDLRKTVAMGRRYDPAEAILAAGIFGLAAVPAFSLVHNQFEPRRRDSSDGSGAGCGGGESSGGSSCGGGAGGGGGCGGGGCGGCGGG